MHDYNTILGVIELRLSKVSYPSVRYEGFMLACLAAHQPQQVSPFLRLSLRTPPALPACCLSAF